MSIEYDVEKHGVVENESVCANKLNKAKKPLADAKIVLNKIEGNQAYYLCRFYVRPYYQLGTDDEIASSHLISAC